MFRVIINCHEITHDSIKSLSFPPYFVVIIYYIHYLFASSVVNVDENLCCAFLAPTPLCLYIFLRYFEVKWAWNSFYSIERLFSQFSPEIRGLFKKYRKFWVSAGYAYSIFDFLWRRVGTHIPHLCRQVRTFCMFS